jgi:phosphatidylglycerophosphate synthase
MTAAHPQTAGARIRWRAALLVPQLLTAIRLASAPLLWWLVTNLDFRAALACLGFAIASDAVDGWLTRRLGSSSRAGAYFDVIADFAVIVAGFSAFAYLDAYPAWLIALIGLTFLVFLLSSRRTPAIYDPVGRYIGGILFAGLGATLMFQDLLLQGVILITVTAALAITLAARAIYVWTQWRRASR